MVYLMHILAAATIANAPRNDVFDQTLRDIGAGRHLSTLAFSEVGSRSHFWAPVSRARADGSDIVLSARKSFVTSAGFADSYIVSALSPAAAGPTESTLYLVPREITDCLSQGSGTVLDCEPTPPHRCCWRIAKSPRRTG